MERVKEYKEPAQVFSISIRKSQLQRIRANATANGMNVSNYLIKCAI
jgi:hypothetical protein